MLGGAISRRFGTRKQSGKNDVCGPTHPEKRSSGCGAGESCPREANPPETPIRCPLPRFSKRRTLAKSDGCRTQNLRFFPRFLRRAPLSWVRGVRCIRQGARILRPAGARCIQGTGAPRNPARHRGYTRGISPADAVARARSRRLNSGTGVCDTAVTDRDFLACSGTHAARRDFHHGWRAHHEGISEGVEVGSSRHGARSFASYAPTDAGWSLDDYAYDPVAGEVVSRAKSQRGAKARRTPRERPAPGPAPRAVPSPRIGARVASARAGRPSGPKTSSATRPSPPRRDTSGRPTRPAENRERGV